MKMIFHLLYRLARELQFLTLFMLTCIVVGEVGLEDSFSYHTKAMNIYT
jgi:hypothetical protein